MLESRFLFVAGYRACGKTSVARALAGKWDVAWVDLDAEIVAATKKTIAEIFSSDGEETFRDFETEQLSVVVAQAPMIVSLGGGAILRPQNRQMIRQAGSCVWLTAKVDTIVKRLSEDEATVGQRPELTELSMEAEVHEMLNRRSPIYQSIADFRVDTDNLSIDEVALAISDWLSSTK